MPHVVLQGNLDLERIWTELNHLTLNDEKRKTIIRIEECFMNATKKTLLVRVTTVEIVPHSFYVMVVQKESKTTIMLDPLTDPEKTVGVKMTLAAIATRILQLAGMEIGNVQRTNIGEYLNMVQNILKS